MRIRTVVVTLGAIVALGAVVVPAAHGAATDTVTITGVSTASGVLAISTTSDTDLNSLDVNLVSGGSTVLSLAFKDFTLTAGTGTGSTEPSTWTLNHAITVSQLPPGSYGVDVSAGDSGGGAATDNSATFPWLMTPTITLSASSPTYSWDNQIITFSGTLSLVNPDGSAVNPAVLAGKTLQLANSVTGNTAITTQSGGAFSIDVGRPNKAAYAAVFPATATIAGAQSGPVTLSAVQRQTYVDASVSTRQLNYGRPLTISGTAHYIANGTQYSPLAKGTVQIYRQVANLGTTPFATVQTNSQGAYSYTFADKSASTYFVYAGGVPGDAFLDQVLTQAVVQTPRVNVALPLKIARLRASLSPFAVLTLKGCLILGNGQFPPGLTLRVESAPHASGPWHLLTNVHGLGSQHCGTAPSLGLPFSYQVKVAAASAYYRLRYGGSSGFQPAVSAVVHEAKTLTKITNFSISPRSVMRNKFVTVSGRLWRYAKGWHPLAHQKVWILAKVRGQWYFYTAKPVTNSAGRFSGKFKVYLTGPWLSEFMGNATYFACASNQLTVTARGGAAIPALRAAELWPEGPAAALLADTGLQLAP